METKEIYKKYRLAGGLIDPDTEYGPADNSNDFQTLGTNAGILGTVASYRAPALDEDACAVESCAGSLGPDVFQLTKDADYTDPSTSPVKPVETHKATNKSNPY